MVWKRLFGKNAIENGESAAPNPVATPELDPSAIMRRRPPAADPAMQSRLDALRRRRDMAAYDLERALTARQQVNPWRERMELLDHSLATIEDDLHALDAIPPLPAIPLPETPITDIEVRLEEPVSIAFTIGPERHRDLSSFGAVLHRVVEEVGHHLLEPILVTLDWAGLVGQGNAQGVPIARKLLLEAPRQTVNQFVEIDLTDA